MGNSFGGFPLIDAKLVRQDRAHYRRDQFPELDRANSLYMPSGRCAAQGWLLLYKSDFDQINPYSTNLVLEISDLTNSLSFQNLTVVQGRCVTTGLPIDADAVYLVEVTDGRGVVSNPWFDFPTISQYNVLAPAYPGSYYANSTNGGTPWTWDQMVGDIWGQMGVFLGAYPGLPETPGGLPSNFIFPGVSAWEGLQIIFDTIGLTVACDLTQNDPYTLIVGGASDPVFAALQQQFIGSLEDDFIWKDGGGGRLPGQVTTYFHRKNIFYGTEETVRKDALQWSSMPLYEVTKPSPAPYNTAPGAAFVWDDFQPSFDENGVILPVDAATADALATEQVTQYFNRIFRGTAGYMRQVYTGVVPFVTGSLVDGVRWFQSYKLGTADEQRCGWRTEIQRGYVWPAVTEPYLSEFQQP